MKVFYNEYLALDGAGTLLNPAYKFLSVDRVEGCHHIQKAGNMYYLIDWSGYIMHSIDVTKVKRIEFGDMAVDCSYKRENFYPYRYTFTKNGEHLSNGGAKEFVSILYSIRNYQLNQFN